MPIANLKNGSMIYDIQKKKPALNIKEGIFYKDIEGFSLKITKKDTDGKTLHDIIIYDHSESDGNNKIIIAEHGFMELTKDEKFLELTLHNGHSYVDINNKKRKNIYRRTNFKKNLIRFDLSSFNIMKNSENLYKGHYAMLSNKQLEITLDSLEYKLEKTRIANISNISSKYNLIKTQIDTQNISNNKLIINQKQQYNIAINKLKTLQSIIKSKQKELEYKKTIIVKHEIEWHRKLSLSVACFLFFIIGSSLGSLTKKGGLGLPILISITFFVFYHVIYTSGEKAAKSLNMTAFDGLWIANIIFLFIAITLIHKAKNDVMIFDLSRIKLSIFTGK